MSKQASTGNYVKGIPYNYSSAVVDLDKDLAPFANVDTEVEEDETVIDDE